MCFLFELSLKHQADRAPSITHYNVTKCPLLPNMATFYILSAAVTNTYKYLKDFMKLTGLRFVSTRHAVVLVTC